MRMINADARVIVNLYDDEHEEYYTKEMTVEDALDSFTVDGCPVIINMPRSVIKKAERSKSNAD